MGCLKSWLGALCLSATVSLAGCGGGSDGDNSGLGSTTGNNPGGAGNTQLITETNIPIPSTTRVIEATDPGGSSQADLSAATYIIVMFWSSASNGSFSEMLGTGFAVGGDLIATNAHVAGEILNRARQYGQFGFSLTKASAFRAETGAEIPLLEALVHPSYNNNTRSPDIGLFVARATLPVSLKLATNAEVAAIRPGNQINLNGFPGDVFSAIFARGFMPGLSIPQATLFTGNVQSLQKFDERSVIDPNNPLSIDMIQHSMDTTGGTSGSPILHNGKVVAVHNSGLQYSTVELGPDGTPRPFVASIATASWGIHVKHLRNLLAEYDTGVMEADKRYRLPPEPALLATAGQSNGDTSATLVSKTLTATVNNPQNPGATHTLEMSIDANLNITGTSTWPANNDNGLGARQFILTGSVDANGALEATDNTPELVPGFRRGFYSGNINPASGSVRGEYFEVNDQNQTFYFSDWTGQLQ